MHDSSGYLQGYNVQAVVTEDQVIVAAEVTQDPSDNHQLVPMVAATQSNLESIQLQQPVGAVVADAGYWSPEGAACEAGPELFIVPQTNAGRAQPPLALTGRIPASATPLQLMERKLSTKAGHAIYARRAVTVEPVFGQIKENRRVRRFQRRGLRPVSCKWKLVTATPQPPQAVAQREA